MNEDEFSVPIGTGMTRVPREEAHEFDAETAAALQARLADFDSMRDRAAVEARTSWIGPR